MSERHNIKLAFSRSRFVLLVGTAVVTGIGLLAAGLFAGIEVGSVQALAASPQTSPETPSPLPLQFAHELPVTEPPHFEAPAADEPDSSLALGQRQYVVQAASFRDREEAARLTDDLTRRGYSARIFDYKDQVGRNWLIVRVGPYAAHAEAAQAATELGRFTRSEPIVRIRDN